MFESITDLAGKLAATGYFIDPVMIKVVFLAAKMQKPLLLRRACGIGQDPAGCISRRGRRDACRAAPVLSRRDRGQGHRAVR